MPLVQVEITDQLLVPFGGPKWSIERIGVVGVSTAATYIQSDTPLAYINKAAKSPLRLDQFKKVVPGNFPEIEDCDDALRYVLEHLKSKCEVATPHERKFLDLYFTFIHQRVQPPPYLKSSNKKRDEYGNPYNTPAWVFQALFPLPQAHLYQADPLEGTFSFAPNRMMKVDFAFWTGKKFVAVEIDGESHVGSAAHVQKDRRLQRAGVEVIHILNSELDKYGVKVIERLMPVEVTKFWSDAEDPYWALESALSAFS